MSVTPVNGFFRLDPQKPILTDPMRERLFTMTNEETRGELEAVLCMAEKIAAPTVLFAVSPMRQTPDGLYVGGVRVDAEPVTERLGGKQRCFPFLATCGEALEEFSRAHAQDPLEEYWLEEIKKYCLRRAAGDFFVSLRENFHPGGHLTTLNPGSLPGWPLSGQRELFDILGGVDFVREQTGCVYTEDYLMLPTKSWSGIAFESDGFFENCQYCPLEHCRERRAARKTEEAL